MCNFWTNIGTEFNPINYWNSELSTQAIIVANFKVVARYYTVVMNGHAAVQCRIALDIVRTDNIAEALQFASNECPDAFAVMMNPGSSKPVNCSVSIR